MHSILISRGNVETRIQMKKMLEGELFLEEIYGNPEDVNKVTGINLWACYADGKPPMNILDESTRAFSNHENLFNTKRTFDRDHSNDEYNIDKQIQKAPWDPTIHPHGASSNPVKNRIAAYDDNGRLRSVDPALGNSPKSDELTQVVTLGRITDDYKALVAQIDNAKKELHNRLDNLIDDAPGFLDQLGEFAKALDNDPDFHNTIKGILNTKADKIELVDAKFESTAHKTAPVLDHPDNSVTADKLANTLGLEGKMITVDTPDLPP